MGMGTNRQIEWLELVDSPSQIVRYQVVLEYYTLAMPYIQFKGPSLSIYIGPLRDATSYGTMSDRK